MGHSTSSFYQPPVILHFDGRAWTDAPQQPIEAWLMAVDAISPTDARAVGYRPLISGDKPLAMHWDGALWRAVPTPNLAEARLNGVSAVSATDVWAVGYAVGPTAIRPLTLHWDGTSWSVSPSPPVPHGDWRILWSVSAASPTDVWAVGDALIEHWDGYRWTKLPPPRPLAALYEVSAVCSDQAWMAGSRFHYPYQYSVTYHGDGAGWRFVGPPGENAALFGVDAISARNVWAVGVATDTAEALILKHPNEC